MEEALPPARPRANEDSTPRESVAVMTTARLHFGFIDPSGRGPAPFGSLGLSLDRPCTDLRLRRADIWSVTGPEAARAERFLRQMCAERGMAGGYELRLKAAIPPHAGLGSGTQLALAIGTAFARLEGIDLKPSAIAGLLGRGARSGIGIGTFVEGGLVLDAGPKEGALPEVTVRVPFPQGWRALLLFDDNHAGLSGQNEVAAFEALPDFPASRTEALGRRVAAAIEAAEASDFAGFCAEVGSLQAEMGAYFGPLQGGAFVSPAIAEIMAALRKAGVTGLGQSSWGPTGFAFAPTPEAAASLRDTIGARAEALGLRIEIARGRNEGAAVTSE